MTFSFGLTPSQALEYFNFKGLDLTYNYDEMLHEAHNRAFTVAKVTRLDLLSDIQESLTTAMREGQTYQQWAKALKPTLIAKGWWGEIESINPKTGEVKNIFVGSKRLKNIYNTNMRTAYAKSHYNDIMQSTMPYMRYSAVLDNRTRLSHREAHGIILPKDHPWWDTHFPPNGWGCRCTVMGVSKALLQQKGWKLYNGTPPNIASPDWSYNVGRDSEKVFSPKMALDSKECNAKGDQCGSSLWKSVSAMLFNFIPRVKAKDLPQTKLDTNLILPQDKPVEFYVDSFLDEFGASRETGVYFKDVIDDMMFISDEMFINRKTMDYKALKNGREIYLKLFATVIKNPLEIWIDVMTDGKHSRIQKRYLDIYVDESGNVAGLVVFDLIDGVWRGTTAFNPSKKIDRTKIDYDYIDEYRKGVLVYERK